MTKKIWPMQDQVFWYLQHSPTTPCRENNSADVAIVGGGMAGLAAAQAFAKRGKKVIVLEQYYCGAGASGKSSGFITPNAELSLTDFSKRYNLESAKIIWDFITSGVNDIRNNITQHNFSCDYQPQDSVVVATSKSALKELATEYDSLIKAGYKASFYTADQLKEHIVSNSYFGGVRYQDTFGINGYAYCQQMKQLLQKTGVTIFEETPVTAIANNTVITPLATITADYIVVCADYAIPRIGLLKQDIYHAQTFVTVSRQLTDQQIKAIFPRDKLMVWDTHLIYNYFRITGDNRLLLGGGNMLSTYASHEIHNYKTMQHKLADYFAKIFPEVDIQFEQMWPGLIGLSKDIVPLLGQDKDNPAIYYAAAATGLPIAAAIGRYSAECLLDGNTTLDRYFSPYRSFPIGGITQSILGNKITFALCNLIKSKVP